MHLFNNIFISTMVKSLSILKPLQKNFGKASILAFCLNTRMTMCFCKFFWSPLQIIITIITNLWSSCSSPLRDQPWLPCSPEVTKALYCSLWAKIIIIIQSWLGHWLFYVFLIQFVQKLGKKEKYWNFSGGSHFPIQSQYLHSHKLAPAAHCCEAAAYLTGSQFPVFLLGEEICFCC